MATVTWQGYDFKVLRPNANWADVPGVYIFAGVVGTKWKAFYIGETDSFKNRPINGHEQSGAAARLGATHVHALVIKNAARRTQIEEALIAAFKPPLNRQHK